MSCESQINNYWWLIIVVGLIVIFLVILIMLLTRSDKISPSCKSAEYPTVAENTSCDPNVVEVSLTSSDNEVQILNGDPTKLYNYNHSFPGPLIEAKVGDTLIVHFFNDISEPSTITFHGLLTDANMDGSSISQRPVQPGKSFTYQIHLTQSGLFYYHSDINSREQVSMGLFGAILVHDYHENDKYSLPTIEKVLAFSDLKLNDKNQVDIAFSPDACERISEQINGIVGNVLLTNGVSDGCISLPRNTPVRLRMVNCSTDRFMKIFIEGHDLLRIGGDQGLLDKPLLIKEGNGLILTTGERADVVFVPRSETIRLFTEANPRGTQKIEKDACGNCELTDKISKNEEKLLLVTFNTYETKDDCKLEVPLKLKKNKKIKVDHCTPIIPVKYGNFICDENVEFYAFNKTPFDYLTAKEAPIVVEDGTYIIEVTNTSPLPNNFHLHGFTFQHIDTIYVNECSDIHSSGMNYKHEIIENQIVENKDTIYIPGVTKEKKIIVRLAVTFKPDETSGHNYSSGMNHKPDGRDIIAFGKEPTKKRSGGWIFQSHILTHADLGQEGFIQIIAECDRNKYSYTDSYSDYSSGDHSTCLTSRFKYSNSYSDSRYSNSSENNNESSQYSSDSLIDSITKSLITCSCGSGLSTTTCSCSNSRRLFLESRLSSKSNSY